MRIEDYNFRDLHHNYVLIKDVTDRFTLYNLEFQCVEGDNSLLTYGYIDHTAGLTFEVLCFAKKDENGLIQLRPGKESISFKIRYDGVLGDIEIIQPELVASEYQRKVDTINEGYEVNTELEQIRNHTLIDNDRSKQFPDDVCAILFKEGVQTEQIWVRTETIIDGKIAGCLINKPYSDAFGLDIGDMVKLVSVPVQGKYVTVIENTDIYE